MDGVNSLGCYHVSSSTSLSWCQGQEYCYRLGADLANPNQATENVLTEIKNQVPGMND